MIAIGCMDNSDLHVSRLGPSPATLSQRHWVKSLSIFTVKALMVMLCLCLAGGGFHAYAQDRVLTVAVLVNSQNTSGYNPNPASPGEFQQLAERYLDHLQVPYEIIDVSTTPPPASLGSRQLIVAGHSGLQLSASWQSAIATAVNAGTGFVNLDSNSSIGTNSHMAAIFGATGSALGTAATQISVPANVAPGGTTPHYIAALQIRFDNPGNLVYPFHPDSTGVLRSATATVLQNATGTVIARLGNDPLILATTSGAGRAVHFGTLNYLHGDRFGFVTGVDDLFWRSLVWAARKPFVVRGYPRLWAVQMDDTMPGWSTRVRDLYNTSFTGTKAADGTGGPWKVTGYLFTDNVGPGSADRANVISDINAGKLEVAPHSFGNVFLGNMYWNASNGALTDQQWQTNMAAIDAWKQGNGGTDVIPSFSRAVVAHYWDLSNNTGSDLWNKYGFRYISSIQKPGFQSTAANGGAERLSARSFWLYEKPPKTGSTTFGGATEDYSYFFSDDYVVGSRAGLPAQTLFLFTTHYLDFSKYARPDFMWPDVGSQTVSSSVAQLQEYTWRYWSGLAPVQVFTHDVDNYLLSQVGNRQAVITQGSAWLNANGARHVFMDELGDYLYARTKSKLTSATLTGTQITYNFTGNAATADGTPVNTQFLLFNGDSEGLWQTVPGFTNGNQVVVAVPAAPTITSLTPNSGQQSQNLNVVIAGTNFISGASCNFGASINVSSCVVNSSSQVTANITILGNAATGSRNVLVTNPDGQIATATNGFTVNAAPGLLHLDFTYPNRSAFLIGGWSFMATTATGASRDTETGGALAVNYDQVAHPGTLRIPVGTGENWENSNNSQNTLFFTPPSDWTSFRVRIASFNPTANYQQIGLQAYQNDDNYIDVNRVFNTASRMELFREVAQATAYINTAALTNTGNLILRLDRSNNTYTGFYSTNGGTSWNSLGSTTVTLTNPKLAIMVGSNTAGTTPTVDLSWVEIVRPVPLPAPTISSLTPNSATQGQTLGVTIAGTNFLTGATCNFGAGITVNSCTFVSASQITANISVAFGATVGTRTVTVTNPDSQSGSLVNGFTVNQAPPAPAPTLASATPNSGQQSQTLNVVLAGTNFISGATCSFGAGITVNSCTWNSATQLTANVSIGGNATAGSRNVTVTNPDAQSVTLTGGFAVTAAPAPTLTSATPNSGLQSQTLNVVLAGTNFISGATCDFGAGVTVNSCTWNSATQITANVSIAGNATTGGRTVTVTNPNTLNASLNNGFSVNQVPGLLHLDFTYPDRATFLNAGWSFIATTATGASRDTETGGTLAVSYDQVAHPGTLRVPVGTGENWQNSNNSQNTLFFTPPSDWTSFRVRIASFNPTANYQQVGLQAYQNDDNYIDVNRVFNTAARMEMFREVAQATAYITTAALSNTGNLILRLDRSGNTYTGFYSTNGGTSWNSLGSSTVTLTNPKLAIMVGSNTAGTTPTVDLSWVEILRPAPLPAPSITSANPNSANQGQALAVTIAGTNFVSGATCSFGAGITVNSCTFGSASQLTANITVAFNATAGTRTITVTNPDGQSGTLVNGFTVNQAAPAPPPTLTSATPSSAQQAQTLSVVLAGTNFISGATCNFGPGITVNTCVVNSATQITAGITIATNAVTGGRIISVTNPDSQSASLINGFVVGVALPPSLTSATPNSGQQSQTLSVVLAGANFISGATCDFGADVTVNSCTVNSATQITAGISISGTAAAGGRTVTVTNPNGTNGSLSNGFTVNQVPGLTHLDFTYPDRTTFLNAGWSFIATTASGASRDTETGGALAVSYDQVAHPGTLRVPVGTGENWQNSNNSQNTLFFTPPPDWTSFRVKIASFNPVANYQQVGLHAYQNDDNYVSVDRSFVDGTRIEMFREASQSTAYVTTATLSNTGNLILRLDRASSTYSGFYSTDGGVTWNSLGSTTVNLTNPKLAIMIGANTSGTTPSADLAWVEILRPDTGQGPDTTPPSVSVASPATSTTISGLTTLYANASDNVGVVGVQFYLDGNIFGSEITNAPYTTTWNTTSATNASHAITAVARDAAGNSTTSAAATVTVSNTNDATIVGSWTNPFSWPIVAINMVVTRTGEVMSWDGPPANGGTSAQLWNPTSGNFTSIPNTLTNMFCNSAVVLSDGRVLAIGGHADFGVGLPDADTFDPITKLWTRVDSMNHGRWYPTSTVLPDGRVLAMSGSDTCEACIVANPEVYNPVTDVWTELPNAAFTMAYYPFMFVMPDGRVLEAGASRAPVVTRLLDVNTQTWTTVDPVVRDGHTAVMYELGKVMKSGTATDVNVSTAPADSTTFTIDMTAPSPSWQQTPNMAYPRAFHTLTLLPDGSVLATGGGSTRDGINYANAVLPIEMWSPQTKTWRTLSSLKNGRLYHGNAVLLLDGRVLVAGSGRAGPAPVLNAEIFSPPYLFKGARPTISSSPASAGYGSTFFVGTPNATAITSVSLLRISAATHGLNMDQRYQKLSFTQGSGGLNVTAPANANLAPPGYYVMFILNGSGVPSVGAVIQIH